MFRSERAVAKFLCLTGALCGALFFIVAVDTVKADDDDPAATPSESAALSDPAAMPSESAALSDPAAMPSEPTVPTDPVETPSKPAVPFDFVASIFTRYELRDNYENVGMASSDLLRYRTRLGLVVGPLDLGRDLKLSIRFVPQASGVWEIGGDTLDDVDLDLHEGFIVFGDDHFQVQVGRMELVYGEHLVIGNVDWHPTGRSFDAVRARFFAGDAIVDAFVSILTEGGTPEFVRGDLYFTGVYVDIGQVIADGFALDVYALAQIRRADASNMVARLARLTIGTRVKDREGRLDYRLEAGLQTGKNGDATILAGHADLEVGVRVAEDKLRLAIEGAFASGDDPDSSRDEAYDQLYPTAHKFLGLADIIGPRTNVISGVFHATATPWDRWRLYVDVHAFLRQQPSVDYAGTEIDSGVVYMIGRGLRSRIGYGLFFPSDSVFANNEAVHFLEVELRYDR